MAPGLQMLIEIEGSVHQLLVKPESMLHLNGKPILLSEGGKVHQILVSAL